MARRHIMTLRVGREFIVVESLPAPPQGYQVTMTRNEIGLAPRLVFDQVRNSTKEAAALFARLCTDVIGELAATETAGVLQRPSRIVNIEEEEVWHG